MQKRIIGIDVARALAVIGMIIVNYKIVFGSSGGEFLKVFVGLFEGKAAATFVTLAGVGLGIMSNSAILDKNEERLRTIRVKIIKRAIVLFVLGLSYIVIWPADILHFYAGYLLLALIVLQANRNTILLAALALIFLFPVLMEFMSFDAGWNFDTLEYSGFWTVNGFLRNFLFNGFHPVIPWASFLLFGLWWGRLNLRNPFVIRRSIIVSFMVFSGIQLLSLVLIELLGGENLEVKKELNFVLGTSPMPPFPIYMLSGMSVSVFIISSCIYFARKAPGHILIRMLSETGKMALTFYVFHVVIGIVVIEVFSSTPLGKFSIEFSFYYALLFSFFCIVFANVWFRFFSVGPFEWMMRRISG